MIQSTTLKKIVSTISILMLNLFGSIALCNNVIENFDVAESFHENYLIRESFQPDTVVVSASLLDGCINCMLDLENCEQKLNYAIDSYKKDTDRAMKLCRDLRNQLDVERRKLRPLREALWIGIPAAAAVGIVVGILIKR